MVVDMINSFYLLRLFVNLSILSWKTSPKSETHHTSLIFSDVYQVDISKWAASWQNLQNDLCPSEDWLDWADRQRSALASDQFDQSLRCPHAEILGP